MQPALEFFRRVIANNRLGHAYALSGPEGVDKLACAIEVAKALLCPTAPGVGCGECAVCGRVEKKIHADLHILAPEPGKREIGIDAIRGELIPTIALTPFEAEHKVFIIEKADSMTEEAADCLLKTLEEPPPMSVLLLLCESADHLQPTIRSRCQIVRLISLRPQEVAKELQERLGLPPEQALALARLSDCNLEQAIAMQESGWQELRDIMLAALASTDSQSLSKLRECLAEAVNSAGRNLESQRRAIRQKLLLMLLCCRDLLVNKLTGDSTLLFNRDTALPQTQGIGIDRWQALVEDILEADEAVLANVNLELLLDHLFRRLS